MSETRHTARVINGMRQRLEAAYLLLGLCPQCGDSIKKTRKRMICSEHGTVCEGRTKKDLYQQLDKGSGIDLGL